MRLKFSKLLQFLLNSPSTPTNSIPSNSQEVTQGTLTFLSELKSKGVTIGIVGGSDLAKQKEQLGEDVLSRYEFNFSQNGLVAYRKGELIEETSISSHLGEEVRRRRG